MYVYIKSYNVYVFTHTFIALCYNFLYIYMYVKLCYIFLFFTFATYECLAAFTERNTRTSTYSFKMGITLVHVA